MLSYPGDLEEFFMGPGKAAAHLMEGPVPEHHEGRHHGLFRQMFPQGLEPAEQFSTHFLGKAFRQFQFRKVFFLFPSGFAIGQGACFLPEQHTDGSILELPDLFCDLQNRVFVPGDQQIALIQQILDHFFDFFQGILVQGTEHPQPGKARFLHPGGAAPCQGIGNQGDPVRTPGFVDAFHDFLVSSVMSISSYSPLQVEQ